MEKKSVMKKITGSREALLAVVLIVLFVIITAINPSFLTPKSLMDMLKNNAVTMVMSLGMLCVMLVGGIDISIMSTLALSGMSIGMLLKYEHISSTFLAFVIAIAIGIVCGAVVGLIISRADVPPIIATMGFMYIYRALGYQVSHGGEWASAAALGNFKNFATTKFLGMSLVIWVIILCYVIFFVFMKWTTIGRRIYAVGSNPSAAEVSGINVKNINMVDIKEQAIILTMSYVLNLLNRNEEINGIDKDDIPYFKKSDRHDLNDIPDYESYKEKLKVRDANRYWDAKFELWPIPQQELDRNPKLVQNKGY